MDYEEFLNIKKYILNTLVETIEFSNQVKTLSEEIDSIDYQLSLLKNDIIILKKEVSNNEFKN